GGPLVAGVLPFALLYGAAARALGLSLGQTAGMSLAVFAGSAQLVFLDLWSQGASLLVIIVTGLVINLRLAMYSASLAPHLGVPGPTRRLAAAYFLTDESYGVSLGRFLSGRAQPASPFFFFLGSAGPCWLSWQAGGLTGYLAGALIPEAAGRVMSLAVPLIFLALLTPLVSRGPRLTAALAAMVMAVAGAGLPLNLGLIAAVVCGLAAGLLHKKIRSHAA
ncbi:MAG: AzlC family ABC transporter permease, partial [Candidatus Adiutrix sp.]|nr:AzlC family ABC transporter permease [Candidatus Adiutrix sp.]